MAERPVASVGGTDATDIEVVICSLDKTGDGDAVASDSAGNTGAAGESIGAIFIFEGVGGIVVPAEVCGGKGR